MKLILIALFFSTAAIAQQTSNKLTVKELDVTSRVNVTSTTKSSKPCPAMTETQRNAIATPLNGSCIYNTTTLKLNVYNGTVWKAAGGGVDNWLTATAYSVDDIVIESSKIYQCLTAHTSGTFATDLAALKWAEISSTIPVNLTGPITSVGNATSITSQTGTGSTLVVQNTPTLTTPNIGTATGTSLTLAGNISAYNYDKDNLLINGNIENPLSTEWTCTVGTCTRTTTAGEFSKDTAALRVALSAQAMNVSQTVTTPSGIQKQGFARVIYRVPATMADFQICTLVDAAEQTCVPTANLIKDDTFRSIEIPLTFGSTSAGIKFKTTSAYSATAYFDGVILSQGLGLQNLQGDTDYSAQVSSTGVVTQENINFIQGNCVSGGTGLMDCTYVSGLVSSPMNCEANLNASSSASQGASVTISTSTMNRTTTVAGGALASLGYTLICQKSGNDYLAASANVYSQASGNYSRRAYTPTFTGFGTVSNVTCLESREGEYNNIECNFTTGTATGVEARVSLPNGNVSSSLGPVLRTVGSEITNGNAATFFGIAPLIEPSVSYLTFGRQDSTGGALSKRLGNNVVADGSSISFTARVPIAGWSNSNVIVGSFENVPTVPGAGARIDTFSVSYGTTNATTVCSASPCSYLDQIGTAVGSITRSSTGDYFLNTVKTYIKLKCALTSSGTGATASNLNARNLTCDNCSSLEFITKRPLTEVDSDSFGTLMCMGKY